MKGRNYLINLLELSAKISLDQLSRYELLKKNLHSGVSLTARTFYTLHKFIVSR
jgi:hypothetical protein